MIIFVAPVAQATRSHSAAWPVTLAIRSKSLSQCSFTVTPAAPVRRLRDTLRAATLSVCPGAPVIGQETAAHVTIAYGNTDNVPAADAIAAVEKLNASGPSAEAAVEEAQLVLLERRQRSYAWELVSRVPLTGMP